MKERLSSSVMIYSLGTCPLWLHEAPLSSQSSEARVHPTSLSPIWVQQQRRSSRMLGLEELLEAILPGYFETVKDPGTRDVWKVRFSFHYTRYV